MCEPAKKMENRRNDGRDARASQSVGGSPLCSHNRQREDQLSIGQCTPECYDGNQTPSMGSCRVDQTPMKKTEVGNESRVRKTDTDIKAKS
jgi:hypothetical protein